MHTKSQRPLLVGALLVLAAAAGCSDSNPVYPVRGRVTFEGKALPGGGSISFVPLGDQAGKTAGGFIGEDGTYELTTYKEGDGSMPGEFRVVITQVTETEPEATPDGERAPKPGKVVAPADRIPLIYSDYENSPLRATVEKKSPNEFNFDLKRDAGGPAPVIRGARRNDRLRLPFAWSER
jgi:hypothetical protein